MNDHAPDKAKHKASAGVKGPCGALVQRQDHQSRGLLRAPPLDPLQASSTMTTVGGEPLSGVSKAYGVGAGEVQDKGGVPSGGGGELVLADPPNSDYARH